MNYKQAVRTINDYFSNPINVKRTRGFVGVISPGYEDDVIQEAHTKLLKSLKEGRVLDDNYRQLIFTTVKNVAITYQRKMKSREFKQYDYNSNEARGSSLLFTQPDYDSAIDREKAMRIIMGIVGKLKSPHQKQVFIGIHIDGKTHREIAAELGIAESTSRSTLWRATQQVVPELRKIPNLEERLRLAA